MDKPDPLILFIPRWYPSEEDPMLGLFVKKHAVAAIKAGYSVVVAYAVPFRDINPERNYEVRINESDKVLEVIAGYNNTGGISGIFRQFMAWRKAVLKAVEVGGKPDLIHAHILTRTGIIALICSWFYKIPFVVTEHWSRYYPQNLQFNGLIKRLLTQLVLRRARKTTVVSNRLVDAMKNCGLKFNPGILPNVVDTDLFVSGNKRDSVKKRIVSITCFDEKAKNLFLLLNAFKTIKEESGNVELVLIGDGVDHGKTLEYAASLGFQPDDVLFKGMLENHALVSELHKADCLALSSNYETFGIVVFEALACGVPVVVTDVADLAIHIEPEMGRVVPVGDVTAFKNALLDVLHHPESFDPEIMRSFVLKNYSPEAISQQMRNLYQPLINRTS